MVETERLNWQETVDSAVDILEMRIGLRLAGLTPPEISCLVREWIISKTDSINVTKNDNPDRN